MNAQLTMPFQSHSETSRAAAESITPGRVESDRRRILEYVRVAYGATDGEIQAALGMDGNTERPRRVELVRAGLLVDSERTRKTASGRNAVVWEEP